MDDWALNSDGTVFFRWTIDGCPAMPINVTTGSSPESVAPSTSRLEARPTWVGHEEAVARGGLLLAGDYFATWRKR